MTHFEIQQECLVDGKRTQRIAIDCQWQDYEIHVEFSKMRKETAGAWGPEKGRAHVNSNNENGKSQADEKHDITKGNTRDFMNASLNRPEKARDFDVPTQYICILSE